MSGVMIFRIKRYSAGCFLYGGPRWEYFTEEVEEDEVFKSENESLFEKSLVEKAKELRDTIYLYDACYGAAREKGKLQAYVAGKWGHKWKTVK